MSSFDFLWQLLQGHGVIPNRREKAAELWNKYSLEQQRHIYRSIRDLLRQGKFVNYDPVIAILNNEPKKPRRQIISADEYYRRYNTQSNRDGWIRVHLKDQQKTIYVKAG